MFLVRVFPVSAGWIIVISRYQDVWCAARHRETRGVDQTGAGRAILEYLTNPRRRDPS
jgi:hypothetical protein